VEDVERLAELGQTRISAPTVVEADPLTQAGAVVSDPKGIAYSDGSNNDRSDLKRLAIAEDENSPYYKGTWADISDRKYPIFRHIFSYSDGGNGAPVNPLTQEFLRMVLSSDGQAALWKEGILPFNAKEANAALAKVK
jgi:phosphate transport system substrate-binding protein